MCDPSSVDVVDFVYDSQTNILRVGNSHLNSSLIIGVSTQGGLDRPLTILEGNSVVVDERLSEVEKGVWLVIEQHGGQIFNEGMDKIANKEPGGLQEVLHVLRDEGICDPSDACTSDPEESPGQGGTVYIWINRDYLVERVMDQYPSDTDTQEKIFILKETASEFLHEVCHHRHPTSDDDGEFLDDEEYWDAHTMGICHKNSYYQIFGEYPPYYYIAKDQMPSYDLSGNAALEQLGDLLDVQDQYDSHLNHIMYAKEQKAIVGTNVTVRYYNEP